MSYFTSLNVLSPLQHGFRPNHFCQTQLIDVIDEVQRSMNARHKPQPIMLKYLPIMLLSNAQKIAYYAQYYVHDYYNYATICT